MYEELSGTVSAATMQEKSKYTKSTKILLDNFCALCVLPKKLRTSEAL